MKELRKGKDEEQEKVSIVKREKDNMAAYYKGEIERIKAEQD